MQRWGVEVGSHNVDSESEANINYPSPTQDYMAFTDNVLARKLYVKRNVEQYLL